MEHPFLLSDENDVIHLLSNSPEEPTQGHPFQVKTILPIYKTIQELQSL